MRIEFVNEQEMVQQDETIPLDEQPEPPTPNYQREMNTVSELLNEMDAVPYNVNYERGRYVMHDLLSELLPEPVQVEPNVREIRYEITNVPTMRA
jgi:hypothetical protein